MLLLAVVPQLTSLKPTNRARGETMNATVGLKPPSELPGLCDNRPQLPSLFR